MSAAFARVAGLFVWVLLVTPGASAQTVRPDSALADAWAVFLGCSALHVAKIEEHLPLVVDHRRALEAAANATAELIDAVRTGRAGPLPALPIAMTRMVEAEARASETGLAVQRSQVAMMAAQAREVAALVVVGQELARLGYNVDPAECQGGSEAIDGSGALIESRVGRPSSK